MRISGKCLNKHKNNDNFDNSLVCRRADGGINLTFLANSKIVSFQ